MNTLTPAHPNTPEEVKEASCGSPYSESTYVPEGSSPGPAGQSPGPATASFPLPSASSKLSLCSTDLVDPPEEFLSTNPRISDFETYARLHHQSIEDPETFYRNEVEDLYWETPYHTLSTWNPPQAEWFVGGETNLAYNCLDRHVKKGLGAKVAIRYETETKGFKDYTFQMLLEEVNKLCNVLIEDLDVKKGDRVLLYMPCCPENVIAMLACTRIGAIHAVVFGGYSSAQIRIRCEECTPKVVITADGTFRRGKPLGLKNIVDEAIQGIEGVKILCLNRFTGAEFTMKPEDYDWETLAASKPTEHPHAILPSEHPTFILYTSGSTGRPKGVVHTLAGYMVGVMLTCKYLLDLQTKDVYWCTADMGWITGHSYVAFGPMLMGATQLIYEGTYNFPDWNVLFNFIQKHSVSVLYTAPTLLKSLMAQNLTVKDFDLKSLRLLGTVGEPTNLTTWQWFFDKIGRRKCPIVDTWWQTETGSHMIANVPGAVSVKPGCATLPFFGIDPVILDEHGIEVEKGVPGRLFIRRPWPSMLRGMWGRSSEEFQEKYFPEKSSMYCTGDNAVMEANGYITILGRGDDQMNVSGHRMGTAELETAILSVPGIAKVAVVPFPDDITGQSVGAFVVPNPDEPNVQRGLNADWTKLVGQVVSQIYGPHGRPKFIYVVDALPETKSGKTMRGLLRELVNIKDSDLPEYDAQFDIIKEKYSTMDKDNSPMCVVSHIAEMLRKQ